MQLISYIRDGETIKRIAYCNEGLADVYDKDAGSVTLRASYMLAKFDYTKRAITAEDCVKPWKTFTVQLCESPSCDECRKIRELFGAKLSRQ